MIGWPTSDWTFVCSELLADPADVTAAIAHRGERIDFERRLAQHLIVLALITVVSHLIRIKQDAMFEKEIE